MWCLLRQGIHNHQACVVWRQAAAFAPRLGLIQQKKWWIIKLEHYGLFMLQLHWTLRDLPVCVAPSLICHHCWEFQSQHRHFFQRKKLPPAAHSSGKERIAKLLPMWQGRITTAFKLAGGQGHIWHVLSSRWDFLDKLRLNRGYPSYPPCWQYSTTTYKPQTNRECICDPFVNVLS